MKQKRRKSKKKDKAWRPRTLIDWNTGERVERPKKGKGSYKRKRKHKRPLDKKD